MRRDIQLEANGTNLIRRAAIAALKRSVQSIGRLHRRRREPSRIHFRRFKMNQKNRKHGNLTGVGRPEDSEKTEFTFSATPEPLRRRFRSVNTLKLDKYEGAKSPQSFHEES
jgi:hypothetical protein